MTFAGDVAYVTSGWSGSVRVHRVRVVGPSLGHGTLTVLDRSGDTVYRVQVARSSHDACVV